MKIIKLKDIIEEGVSHNPEIKKKIMIDNNQFNNIMSFGHAKFTSNQKTTPHKHNDMDEIFFITKGSGIFHTEKHNKKVSKGDCISIPAKEIHWQSNPFKNDFEMIYFGVLI